MNCSALQLSVISSVYFDQRSADSFHHLLQHYAAYDRDVLRKVQFVFVDDCSKVQIDIPDDIGLNFMLLRIKDDIAWNNAGGRNLGAVHARTSKIILTDIDHIYPEKLLKKILAHSEKKSVFYKFKRSNSKGEHLRTPRNLLYMTKSVFFDALGYDEEFCGHYGFEDSFFIELLQARKNSFRYFSRFSKVIESDVDRTNSYHNYSRSTDVNLELYERKKLKLSTKNPLEAHSRTFLNFRWEMVKERMNVL